MSSSRYKLLNALAVSSLLLVTAGCTSNGSGVTLQTLSSSQTTVSSTSNLSSVRTATSASPTGASPSPEPTPPASLGSTKNSRPPSATAVESSTLRSTESREAADRRAIEALWPAYLQAAQTLAPLPAGQRVVKLSAFAVNPALQQALATAANFAKNGWVGYGAESIVHRVTWPQPIDGKSAAVIRDCMDDYNYGSKDATTGKKLTGGVHRDNTQITFVRRVTGTWAVSKIEFLVKVPC